MTAEVRLSRVADVKG